MIMSKRFRIIFMVPRSNHFSVLGPVIDAAVRDPQVEAEVVLLQVAKSHKKGLMPVEDAVPGLIRGKCPVRVISDGEEFHRISEGYDAIISITRRSEYLPVSPSPSAPVWCTVYDSVHNCIYSRRAPELSDFYLWPTPAFSDFAVRCGLAEKEVLSKRSAYVGYLRSDHVGKMSRSSIRGEWGLPGDKRVVLFIPDGFLLKPGGKPRSISSWYYHCWLRDGLLDRLARAVLKIRSLQAVRDAFEIEVTHGDVITSLRRFCDNNDALLAVLPRRPKEFEGERQFTKKELEAADFIIEEREYYPQTIMKAAQIADLIVSPWQSECLMDGVAAGAPYVNVKLRGIGFRWEELGFPGGFEFFDERADVRGVTWHIPPKEFVDVMNRGSFDDFTVNKEKQENYFSRYMGPVDGHCGERALEAIKRFVEARKGRQPNRVGISATVKS